MVSRVKTSLYVHMYLPTQQWDSCFRFRGDSECIWFQSLWVCSEDQWCQPQYQLLYTNWQPGNRLSSQLCTQSHKCYFTLLNFGWSTAASAISKIFGTSPWMHLYVFHLPHIFSASVGTTSCVGSSFCVYSSCQKKLSMNGLFNGMDVSVWLPFTPLLETVHDCCSPIYSEWDCVEQAVHGCMFFLCLMYLHVMYSWLPPTVVPSPLSQLSIPTVFWNTGG